MVIATWATPSPPNTPGQKGEDIFRADFFNSSNPAAVHDTSNFYTVASITNFTSFNLERDFFNPADAFVLVIEDDRAKELTAAMAVGMGIQFSINDQNIMYGYIFDYHMEYNRTAHRLTITGQDLLGWMNKAVMYPNGGKFQNTNFHFQPTDTIQFALQTIFNAFAGEAQLPQNITVEVSPGLAETTFQTGFATGLKATSKTGRGLSKSLTAALNHLSRPMKGETHLAYAIRIAKHIGANIKMKQGSNSTIIVAPPSYDIPADVNFYLDINHDYNTSEPLYDRNNVLSGSVKIDIASQPSVIIAEIGNSGDNAFYKSAYKAVVVNEIVGYPRVEGGTLATKSGGGKFGTIVLPIDSVSQAINQLTVYPVSQGYDFVQPNQQLYDNLSRTIMPIQTGVSLPKYYVDSEAHTNQECLFGAALAMAEAQDKYIVLNYEVDKFTTTSPQNIWYPNQMVTVYDVVLSQDNPINGYFWLKKVNWTKSRESGLHSHLELTLPYTHAFDVSPGSNIPSSVLGPDETTDPQWYKGDSQGLYVKVTGKFIDGKQVWRSVK